MKNPKVELQNAQPKKSTKLGFYEPFFHPHNKTCKTTRTTNEPIRVQPAIWQPQDMLEITWAATSTSSLEHEKQSRKNRGSAAWHSTSLADIATRSMPTESYQPTARDICNRSVTLQLSQHCLHWHSRTAFDCHQLNFADDMIQRNS